MKRPGGFPTGIVADVALIVAALATVALTWDNRRSGRIVTAPTPEAPANWRDEIPKGIRWGTGMPP
jgi:hypothetical protein